MRGIRSLALALWLAFSGCASPSTRLAGNLKYAEVHKTVRLPRAEVEQIIRTVSRESIFPILLITQDPPKIGGRIIVYTDLEHDPQRYMVYEFQKQPDGSWHIISSGRGSIIVIPDMQ